MATDPSLLTQEDVQNFVNSQGMTLAVYANLTRQFARPVEVWAYVGQPSREGQPAAVFVRDNGELREEPVDRKYIHQSVLQLAEGIRASKAARAFRPEIGHGSQVELEDELAESEADLQAAAGEDE